MARPATAASEPAGAITAVSAPSSHASPADRVSPTDREEPDPALLATARRIWALSPAEREEYRAQLTVAPASDPHLAHDWSALADRLLGGERTAPA